MVTFFRKFWSLTITKSSDKEKFLETSMLRESSTNCSHPVSNKLFSSAIVVVDVSAAAAVVVVVVVVAVWLSWHTTVFRKVLKSSVWLSSKDAMKKVKIRLSP